MNVIRRPPRIVHCVVEGEDRSVSAVPGKVFLRDTFAGKLRSCRGYLWRSGSGSFPVPEERSETTDPPAFRTRAALRRGHPSPAFLFIDPGFSAAQEESLLAEAAVNGGSAWDGS